VKGDLFIRTMSFVAKKWGSAGLSRLPVTPESFKSEMWYSYKQFVGLLVSIHDTVSDEGSSYYAGREVMSSDQRWRYAFKGQDPQALLCTTSRQDALFRVGDFDVVEASPGFLRLSMRLWDVNASRHFEEFYRGQLQGVLDLSRVSGGVERRSRKDEKGPTTMYDIMWLVLENEKNKTA